MKNVLVIGANSAIAEACIHLFAAKGNNMFLVARNSERLESLVRDLKVRGAKEVHSLVADLGQLDTHPKIVSAVKTKFPKVDVLLIAYGVLPNQKECENNVHNTVESINVNLLSPISLLTLWAIEFEAQKSGVIAVISSVAGDRGRQSNYVYGSAKGGLALFLEGLRNRLDKNGVTVLTIKPGFVDTPMTAEFEKGLLWAKPEQIAKGIIAAIEKRKDVAYLPRFWKPVMLIIQHIPEKIFKRLSL